LDSKLGGVKALSFPTIVTFVEKTPLGLAVVGIPKRNRTEPMYESGT
jgi:hypothetical protein